jgi:hypothetical protein
MVVRVPWCQCWSGRDRWFWWWLGYLGVGVVETGGCNGGYCTVVSVLEW